MASSLVEKEYASYRSHRQLAFRRIAVPRRPRTVPRKRPRQQRSQATVEAILDATARVLCTTGYDRASTNRIALAAGVSVGSLYQYFPSKEALVAALVERHVQQMTSLVQSKLAEVAAAPLPVAVRTMIDVMFDAHAIDPRLHKVLIEQVPRVGRLEHVVGVEREMEALVALFLEARKHELRRTRLAATAFVLCNVVEAVTHAAVLAELEPRRTREVAEELTDMVLRYLPST
jgi:AcrR family transcriptional regulator